MCLRVSNEAPWSVSALQTFPSDHHIKSGHIKSRSLWNWSWSCRRSSLLGIHFFTYWLWGFLNYPLAYYLVHKNPLKHLLFHSISPLHCLHTTSSLKVSLFYEISKANPEPLSTNSTSSLFCRPELSNGTFWVGQYGSHCYPWNMMSEKQTFHFT